MSQVCGGSGNGYGSTERLVKMSAGGLLYIAGKEEKEEEKSLKTLKMASEDVLKYSAKKRRRRRRKKKESSCCTPSLHLYTLLTG